MNAQKIEKLLRQKADLEVVIRSARSAITRAEKAARRRAVAALVERAIRSGASAQDVQDCLDKIGAKDAPMPRQPSAPAGEVNHE